MARKLLREIAKGDGANTMNCHSFAECCIHILQSGCRYNSSVENHIKRLLEPREDKICMDILSVMSRPHRWIKKARELGPPPPGYIARVGDDAIPYFTREDTSQYRGHARWESPLRHQQSRNEKRRWDSRDNDHNRDQYRNNNEHHHTRRRRRGFSNNHRHGQNTGMGRRNRPKTDKVGGMVSERGGTHARSETSSSKPKGQTDGSSR